MKNIRFFLSENFQFLVVKFSVYLNRHVFVMQIVIITNLVVVSSVDIKRVDYTEYSVQHFISAPHLWRLKMQQV